MAQGTSGVTAIDQLVTMQNVYEHGFLLELDHIEQIIRDFRRLAAHLTDCQTTITTVRGIAVPLEDTMDELRADDNDIQTRISSLCLSLEGQNDQSFIKTTVEFNDLNASLWKINSAPISVTCKTNDQILAEKQLTALEKRVKRIKRRWPIPLRQSMKEDILSLSCYLLVASLIVNAAVTMLFYGSFAWENGPVDLTSVSQAAAGPPDAPLQWMQAIQQNGAWFAPTLATAPIASVTLTLVSILAWERLFPRFVFHWGEQKHQLEKRVRFGKAIAAAVAILGSLASIYAVMV